TVTNQTVGQRTITRNFEFILTSGKWLLNNVYASRDAVLCWLCWNVKPASTTNASGKYWHQGWLAASGYRQHGCPRMSEQAADRYLRTGAAAEVEGKLSQVQGRLLSAAGKSASYQVYQKRWRGLTMNRLSTITGTPAANINAGLKAGEWHRPQECLGIRAADVAPLALRERVTGLIVPSIDDSSAPRCA